MNRSIEHQNRSGAAGMPIGVFDRHGNKVPVPAGVDPSAYAQEHGYEPLICCLNHPDTPAVDCVICVPTEEN